MEHTTHNTTDLVASHACGSELDPLPICTHVFNKGRHCRQAVPKPGDRYCAAHAHRPTQPAPLADPLAQLATEMGDASEIADVSRFIAKVLRLACQNRISIRRATALTYIANSLLNSIRLLNAQAHLAATTEPDTLEIDWRGIPRPDREQHRTASTPPASDSVHIPVTA